MVERVFRPGLYLFILMSLTAGLYLAGAASTHFAWKSIAPQFTPNPPLNQKMLFLKTIWPEPKRATAVIGASMALNNFDSDFYRDYYHQPVINFGANGLSLFEAWRFYQDGRADFPIGDVILVTQFSELKDDERREFVIPPSTFDRYIRGKINWIEEFSYRDLQGFLHIAQNEKTLLFRRSDYSSSDFTKTGDVPLEIYGSAIDAGRWNAVGLSEDGGCRHCGGTLAAICREAVRGGRDFTLIMPPLSPYIRSHRADIEARYQRGRSTMRGVMAACGGRLFDVGGSYAFDDRCFVDFEHLNARGMRALTELYVGWRRNKTVEGLTPVACAPPAKIALAQAQAVEKRSS